MRAIGFILIFGTLPATWFALPHLSNTWQLLAMLAGLPMLGCVCLALSEYVDNMGA